MSRMHISGSLYMHLSKEKFKHDINLNLNSKCFIYQLTNKITGKKYVGQTCGTCYYLFARYRKEVKNYTNRNKRYIIKSITKYGFNAFYFEILEYCKEDQLNEKEMEYIKIHQTKSPSGYNLSYGGENERGWKWSKCSKEKLKESLKFRDFNGDKNPFFGRQHTEHTRQCIVDSNKKRNGEKRKPLSKEAKLNISQSLKGKRIGVNNHKSKCYCIISKDGEVFNICGGFRTFCKKHNIPYPPGLILVANGKKENHHGWKCKFIGREETSFCSKS